MGGEPLLGEADAAEHFAYTDQHGAATHEHDEDDEALHDVDHVEHQPAGRIQRQFVLENFGASSRVYTAPKYQGVKKKERKL